MLLVLSVDDRNRLSLIKQEVIVPGAASMPAPCPDVGSPPLLLERGQCVVGVASSGASVAAATAATQPPAEAASEGSGSDVFMVDRWVSSEVDPFLSAVRRGLLRDRPADISAYVSKFCNGWRGGEVKR